MNIRNLSLPTLAVAAVLGLFLAAPAAALSTGQYQHSLGLSDLGYIADGDSISYTHIFDPVENVVSVDNTELSIVMVDDAVCGHIWGCVADWWLQAEYAQIDLNTLAWESGSASATIFEGDVTLHADLQTQYDQFGIAYLDVTVTSTGGDFVVLGSLMDVDFTYDDDGGSGSGTGTSPMPEPSAALVFTLGALVVSGKVRRR